MRFNVGDRVRFHWRGVITGISIEGRGEIVKCFPIERGTGLYKVASEDHDGARFYVTEDEVQPIA